MPTNVQLYTQIDEQITDKTTAASISPTDVGENIKAAIEYTDQEVADAKAEVARPYKVYSATINQVGNAAPTVVVLENTFPGTIVWSRVQQGRYIGTLTAAFTTAAKFFALPNKIATFVSIGDVLSQNVSIIRGSANTVQIDTYSGSETSDDILQNISFEVRQYN